MAHDDKRTEKEILLLLEQKLNIYLDNHREAHVTVDKRLDAHGSQLKMIWGSGSLITAIAGLLGMKGH